MILNQIHYLESKNKLDLTGRQQHGVNIQTDRQIQKKTAKIIRKNLKIKILAGKKRAFFNTKGVKNNT